MHRFKIVLYIFLTQVVLLFTEKSSRFCYFRYKLKYQSYNYSKKAIKCDLNSDNLYNCIIKLSYQINSTGVKYHGILPFHGNGIPKKDLDYHDYFDQNKIFIHHYSQYLNHNDRYENDTSFNIFLPKDLKEDNELVKKLNTKKFTLIYLLTISKISSFFLRQIKGMSHQEVAFLIFIDNKSNRTKLYNLFSQIESPDLYDNLYFIDSPRFVVEWSQISILFSQIVMMCAAFKYFPNSMYISLHSETDYRTIPNDQIMKYLKINYPTNYIAFTPKRKLKMKMKRLRNFKLFVNDADFLEKKMRITFPNRLMPKFDWSFGSNWLTLTLSDTKIMINTILSNFEIIDFFDYVSVSDEVLFQTMAITANIKYENTNHRYINWKKGGCHPKKLDENDFEDIVNNTCNFWARKFDFDLSQKLLDMIDDYVEKAGNSNQFKTCKN